MSRSDLKEHSQQIDRFNGANWGPAIFDAIVVMTEFMSQTQVQDFISISGILAYYSNDLKETRKATSELAKVAHCHPSASANLANFINPFFLQQEYEGKDISDHKHQIGKHYRVFNAGFFALKGIRYKINENGYS